MVGSNSSRRTGHGISGWQMNEPTMSPECSTGGQTRKAWSLVTDVARGGISRPLSRRLKAGARHLCTQCQFVSYQASVEA